MRVSQVPLIKLENMAYVEQVANALRGTVDYNASVAIKYDQIPSHYVHAGLVIQADLSGAYAAQVEADGRGGRYFVNLPNERFALRAPKYGADKWGQMDFFHQFKQLAPRRIVNQPVVRESSALHGFVANGGTHGRGKRLTGSEHEAAPLPNWSLQRMVDPGHPIARGAPLHPLGLTMDHREAHLHTRPDSSGNVFAGGPRHYVPAGDDEGLHGMSALHQLFFGTDGKKQVVHHEADNANVFTAWSP